MKQTGHHTDEPLQLYSDFKIESFNKSMMTVDAVLDNIAANSLRPEDKKELLVKLMQTIQFEILTKF
jgi:hypothetical protein